jgi:environmental stress-induced protein Ves
MEIRKFIKENLTSTNWSGGTTTQLYIYPENADFTSRQFDFRISTATIDVESSDFTPLKGFERKLLVLSGNLELEHAEHHSKKMVPFEQDYFLGEWQTKSRGKAVDFNVIYRAGMETHLFAKTLVSGESISFNTDKGLFIYVFSGLVRIGNQTAQTGDLVEVFAKDSIAVFAEMDSTICTVEWKKEI